MPTVIPDKLNHLTSPAVARLFRVLKKLPEGYTIWHNFTPHQPHFLVLSADQRAFLIHVAETTEALAQSAIQLELLEPSQIVTPDTLADHEFDLLSRFPLPPGTPLRRLLIFPNASQNTLDQVVLHRSKETEIRFLGLHQSSSQEFLSSLEKLASEPIPESALYTLRATFTPESVIPPAHRPPLIAQEKNVPEIPAFLDLKQEKLFKQDLETLPDGEDPQATYRLVTGPAGSGKSLVLLHRALLAARLHEGSRILILTHNKPIFYQLRERFGKQSPSPLHADCRTFFSWATHQFPLQKECLSDQQMRRRLALLKTQEPALAHFDASFLADEINYLRDLGIDSLQGYLDLDRSGRLTALQPKTKESIWHLLDNYRQMLAHENLTDWHEIALQFHEVSRSSPQKITPKYDFIFIDEAQFFAKIWFTPVLAALKPNGQLFLTADPTQGFLKRRQSWKDLGIDVIGRSHRLGRVYRSTRPIAQAARQFFLNRKDTQETDLDSLPDLIQPEDLAALHEGEKVHFFEATNPAHEIIRAAEIITRQLEKSPHLRGHLLVIDADPRRSFSLKENLERHLGPDTVRNLQAARNAPQPNNPLCHCSSLQAATGLEASSVILLGLDSLLEIENDLTLSSDSAHELRNSHTRLIYVALTRAIARLSIITRQRATWENLLEIAKKSFPS